MAIPFYEQYAVERQLNYRYQWLTFVFIVLILLTHGILFHWLPRLLRSKRSPQNLNHKPYFKFLKFWESWVTCFSIRVPWKSTPIFFQPSLVLLGLAYITVLAVFCYRDTLQLDYLPQYYIIGKRVSKVAMGMLPILLIALAKNDLITSITGLQHDRVVFLHVWLGRTLWTMITIHLTISVVYWTDMTATIMIFIPPQIFGMISYGCLSVLTFGSNKWLRKYAYEVFLVSHRIFAFIMLLLAFFHNGGNKAIVIISVHVLVADRVISRIFGIVHKYKSPTKGLSDFEIIDDETILITIPIRKTELTVQAWYTTFLPKFQYWKAGQHVYLTVGKISAFQQHPFTICSLPESKDMKFLVRTQKGFTKKLMITLKELKLAQEEGVVITEKPGLIKRAVGKVAKFVSAIIRLQKNSKSGDFAATIESSSDSSLSPDLEKDLNIVQLKATFHGPYGSKHQDFLTFDTCLFMAAGSGASYTLPVALDLLNTIEKRNLVEDYFCRPAYSRVHIVWTIKKEDNIRWYKHLLEPIMKHVNEGRAVVSIYITQDQINEKAQGISNDSGVMLSADEGFSRIQSSMKGSHNESSGYKNSTIEEITTEVYQEGSNSDLVLESSRTSTSLSSTYHYDLIQKHNGRPNLGEVIKTEADILSVKKIFRSLAVVSCGPKLFINTIKVECQQSRLRKDAPDVYCYTESF